MTAQIPQLAREVRIGLDAVGLSGAVAVCRPLSVDDVARHFDAFAQAEPNVRACIVVRERMQGIEGLSVESAEGLSPYEHANPLHWASLPVSVVRHIFAALVDDVDAFLFPVSQPTVGVFDVG